MYMEYELEKSNRSCLIFKEGMLKDLIFKIFVCIFDMEIK